MKSLRTIIWGLILFLASCNSTTTIKPTATNVREIKGIAIGYNGVGEQIEAKTAFANPLTGEFEERIISKSSITKDGIFDFKLREELPDEWLVEPRFDCEDEGYIEVSNPKAKTTTRVQYRLVNPTNLFLGTLAQGTNRNIFQPIEYLPLGETYQRIERIYSNQKVDINGSCFLTLDIYRTAFNLKLKKGWNLASITFTEDTNTATIHSIAQVPTGIKWFYYSPGRK